MGLLSDIFNSISGDANARPIFDNNGQQGALGQFGSALRNLSVDPKYSMQQGANTPSALQELAAFQQMTPEQQKIYWNIKRNQWQNLGGQMVNPATGEILQKTLPPQDQPSVRGEQARQTAVGTAVGTTEGTQEKKAIQAPQVLDLLDRAEKLLPNATSGGAAKLKRDVAGFFGSATSGSEADTQLDVIGAALTAGVPRMEGPQSNYDVKLYEKAAGDLANPDKPIEVRKAAIKTLRSLQEKYASGGQTTQAAPATGARKTISFDQLK